MEKLKQWWAGLPHPVAILLAAAWYGVLVMLALIGAIEPHASFQYLAM